MAVQLHHLAQVGHHLVAPAVVGNFEQPHVEAFVGGEEAVAIGDAGFELPVQRLQLDELRVGGGTRHAACGVAFEQRQQLIHLGQVALGHFGDVGAAAQLHRHQAFGGQYLQRLAQRRAADTEVGGERLFVEPASRRQGVREDAAAQPLGHLHVERAGGQAPRHRRAHCGGLGG